MGESSPLLISISGVLGIVNKYSVVVELSLFSKIPPLVCLLPGGVVNCALWDMDRSKPKRDHSSSDELQSIIKEIPLHDAGCAAHPQRSSECFTITFGYVPALPRPEGTGLFHQGVHFSDHHMVAVSLVSEKP